MLTHCRPDHLTSPGRRQGPARGFPSRRLVYFSLALGEEGRAGPGPRSAGGHPGQARAGTLLGVGASRLASPAPFPATPISPKLSIPPCRPTVVSSGAKGPESKGGSACTRLFPLLVWTGAAPRALPETRGPPEPQGFPSAHPTHSDEAPETWGAGKLGSWSRLPCVARPRGC